MTPADAAAERIREIFARRFSFFNLHLPEDDVCERRKGSLPYGNRGWLYYAFGEEGGRIFLEYDIYYGHGRGHGRIDEDDPPVGLPELQATYAVKPDLPDVEMPEDPQLRRAETQTSDWEDDGETLTNLIGRGAFDDEPVPTALLVDRYLVMRGERRRTECSRGTPYISRTTS